MDPKNDRTPSEEPRPAEQLPAPKKRFRIEKLEERIAPKKGGNGTKNFCNNSSNSSGGYSIY